MPEEYCPGEPDSWTWLDTYGDADMATRPITPQSWKITPTLDTDHEYRGGYEITQPNGIQRARYANATVAAEHHAMSIEYADRLEADLAAAHEFIRDVAWRFSDHATANWSPADVRANVADFFGIPLAELEEQMERAAEGT